MSPRLAAARRLLLPLFSLSLSIASSTALATPFSAFTDHSGEVHADEDHKDANLEGIILVGTDLARTSFKNAVLRDAILVSANLTDAELKGADLTGADLTGAILTRVAAKDADFTNAILDGVRLGSGDVKNAIFVGASLLGADLGGLSNADRADFTGARYDAATIFAPGMNAASMVLVPEPSSAVLLLLGLIGLELCARRGPVPVGGVVDGAVDGAAPVAA